MKLLILLLNNLPLLILGNNIKIQGSFFPSLNEQKLFKYYVHGYGHVEIMLLDNIPIFPYTSISVIALDTKQMYEKQSELAELDKCVSNICSKIDWENDSFQQNSSPWMKSRLSNQYKLATFFTSGFHLDPYKSPWKEFFFDFEFRNAALNKLKENLEIYIPKSSINSYDIEFSNYEYYFDLQGHVLKDSAGSHKKTFDGILILRFDIPYTQEFLEETKVGLLDALKCLRNLPNQKADKILEATNLEKNIRDNNFNKAPCFIFEIRRKVIIEKTIESSGRNSYNITFERLEVNTPGRFPVPHALICKFINRLSLEDRYLPRKGGVNFYTIEDDRKNDIQEINSIFEEHFYNSREEKSNSVFLLVLCSCLAIIAITSLGYYYREKVKKFLKSLL